MNATYRPDIDGLRGIAVLAVLLFHIGAYRFRGGYVGVDIFFVISGCLITGIILKEVRTQTFSVVQFYERRIRRIVPALVVTLTLCLVAGALLLSPTDFKSLGESEAAVTLFGSNVLFWTQAGYFDAPAEHKPMLHTWSLGVEEQFYILFPLFLVAIHRYGRSRFALWLSVCAAVSMAVAVYGVSHAPVAAFYLAPTRVWELMIGAIIACGVLPESLNPRLRNILAAVGLALIAVSIFRFKPATRFPGLAALVPTGGTALIIYTGGTGRTWVGRLLSFKPIVFVGLISYSLYMLHWPLIVFVKQFQIVELSRSQQLLVLLAAFVVAALSWRFVERPFRSKQRLDRRRVFAIAGVALLAFLAIGLFIDVEAGVPQRFQKTTLVNDPSLDTEWQSSMRCRQLPAVSAACTLGNPTTQPAFLLWGDSHAHALAAGVSSSASRQSLAGLLAWTAICPPLLGVETTVLKSGLCSGFNESVLKFLEEHSEIHTVILAARWAVYDTGFYYKEEGAVRLADPLENNRKKGNNADLLMIGLNRMVQRLSQMNRKVVLVDEVPEIGYQVPAAFMVATLTGRDLNKIIGPARKEYDRRNRGVHRTIDSIRQMNPVAVVDPASKLCDEGHCRVVDSGRVLYRDDDHLSSYGSRYVSSLFDEHLIR